MKGHLLAAALAVPMLGLAAPQYGTPNADMPPLRFQGDSVSVVVFTSQAGIEEYCGKATPGFVMIACHREAKNGASIIFMPNPCPVGELDYYAKIMCHENGHSLGWTANHEQ